MPGLCEDMWNKVGVDWHVTLPSLPLTWKPFIFHLYPERAGGHQTRPPKSIPVFRPVLWAPDLAFRQKLHHHYLDSVCNQKNSSNAFRICIFLLLSYSFGIETINTFIHSHSTLENHTQFQTKMGKVYTCFQTKTWPDGAAHTYIACIREYPPGYMDSRALWMGRSKAPSGIVPGQRDKSDKKTFFMGDCKG